MIFRPALAGLMGIAAAPAYAQDTAPPPDIAVSGGVALVSDYRFRGISQSDKDLALQGGVTVRHVSGVYAGVWSSNLSGWGSFGGPGIELDFIGGYSARLAEGKIDVGVTWYTYPGGANRSDFAEPYAKLSGTIGPASLLAGVAYAPPQRALGNFSGTPQSRGQKADNLYVWGDGSVGLPGTPFTAKAHIGHSRGNPGLGPNGFSLSPTGRYWDWSLGLDYVRGPFTFGAAYTGTDIGQRESAYLRPNFASTRDGSSIAAGRVVLSIGVAF